MGWEDPRVFLSPQRPKKVPPANRGREAGRRAGRAGSGGFPPAQHVSLLSQVGCRAHRRSSAGPGLPLRAPIKCCEASGEGGGSCTDELK